MSDIKFRSDMPVFIEDDGCCGSDRLIARAAWVIEPGLKRDGEGPDAYRRVITAMLKGRHGTPFEKGLMTVYVEAPSVVWWEWTRHRFMGLDTEDFSFSLESGRYRILDGEFYVPPKDRPVREPDGFRPMKPSLVPGSEADLADITAMIPDVSSLAWLHYQQMTQVGIAREIARLVLPFNIYYAGYVSANPRTWLQFFSLRKHSPDAKFDTRPQWEIQDVCEQCEALFQMRWPITYQSFLETGRVSP